MSVLQHEHSNQGGTNHRQSSHGMSHCFARSCHGHGTFAAVGWGVQLIMSDEINENSMGEL